MPGPIAEANLEFLSTRIPAELKDEIDRMAEEERRPVSLMTRILLEEAVAARSKKTKK